MFALPEKVTVWNVIAGSGYAGYTYSAPVTIDARTADRIRKVVDRMGADKVSSTSVYFESDIVQLDSKIVIGESLATIPPSEARDVITFAATPSYTNLKVAYL